ncbi:acyl carrier protein [Streptomyces flavofungini]|uniref:acyl carrier protein n=1 Tax=Streptomyces flavofungini TaxID=68200 RepID=UPI0025AF1942|nr:phosphopantetheine-binding protein [Streptomyces flavofungini]WJV45003.1 phosphopantetheine-binding protein [Streptomyces flavofungini]
MSAMYGRLLGVLVGRFDVDLAEITPDTTFDDLGMDSLYLVELFLVVHAELGVAVGEEAARPGDTVGAVAEVLARRAGKEGVAPVVTAGSGGPAQGPDPVRGRASAGAPEPVGGPDPVRAPTPVRAPAPTRSRTTRAAPARTTRAAPPRTPRPAPAPAPPPAADRTGPAPAAPSRPVLPTPAS